MVYRIDYLIKDEAGEELYQFQILLAFNGQILFSSQWFNDLSKCCEEAYNKCMEFDLTYNKARLN